MKPNETKGMPPPVTLQKGGHRWIFHCDAASLPEMCKHIACLARDTTHPHFDWFDAGLVKHALMTRFAPAGAWKKG